MAFTPNDLMISFDVAIIILIIYIIVSIVKIAGGGKGGGHDGGHGGYGGGGDGGSHSAAEAAKRAKHDEEKAEKKEKKALAAVADLGQLATEMELIKKEKLDKLKEIEENEEFHELKSYETQKKMLAEMLPLLRGSWNAGWVLSSTLSKMNKDRIAYKDQLGDVEEHLGVYKEFIDKVSELLYKLKEAIRQDENTVEYRKKLESTHKAIVRALGKIDDRAADDLRRAFKLLVKGQRLVHKDDHATFIEHGLTRNIDEINEQQKILITQLLQKVQAKSNDLQLDKKKVETYMNILGEISRLNREDQKSLEEDIKFLDKYRKWKLLNKGFWYGIGNFLILQDKDVRMLLKHCEQISRNLESKVRFQADLNSLRNEQSNLEANIEKINEIVLDVEKVLMKEGIKEIEATMMAKKET
ncbi:hypothetical protein J4212_00710 [Candidatus Woesearchaeota archaeon]|nr:hypothetical protein [Candidatus Woesearchaeota archaeon]